MVEAALGNAPFDVLLRNGLLIDVATSEIREADIGIAAGRIASVHPRGARSDAAESYDFAGRHLAPGLIDTHVHFESSHLTPANYAAAVVPQGTTTILFDPHELANVLGLAGVRYAIDASRGLPLRFLCAAPSSVPSAPGLETSGAAFGGSEMREMLSWPEVAGVAEVMDMGGVLEGSRRMREIMAEGLLSGKIIEGHARGLSGARLQAYAAAGVSSDHEVTSAEDAIEKLRAGLTVEIRGSHDYVLPGLVEAVNRLPQIPSTLAVCTDDVPPDFLLERGGMCDVLRRLIRYGMDPVQAFRCATLNAAARLRRPDLGLLAPGRVADVLVLSDLREVAVESVFIAGKPAARQGRLLNPVADRIAPPRGHGGMRPLLRDDCRVPTPGIQSGRARIRTIREVRFTSWGEIDVEVSDGYAELPPGCSVLLVQHRHGRHAGGPQRAVVEGWGELAGAVATTYSHDAHNLVVLGRRPEDMQAAAGALGACGGGMAVAAGGSVIAKVEMPVAGILSAGPLEPLASDYAAVREAAGRVIEWEPPYRVFKALEGTCLACNAGPHLTDLGLTDGGAGEILEMLIARLDT